MATLRSDELEAHIQSGRLGSLYVFDGPENWLKERAVTRITKKLIAPESTDFNLDRYDGKSCSAGEVIASAQSLPWMSDRRLVIVRSADEFSAPEARLLGENLSSIPASTCLIFLYDGKANLREEIPAHVSSHGAIVTFWTPFPNQLPMWVRDEAKLRGKTITTDAAMALAESCDDLQGISNELDKLSLFVGKKTAIDMQDIKAHGLPDDMGNFRDFETAIWEKRLPDALRQGELMSEMGVRSEQVFPIIERVFRTVLLGHFYLQRKKWKMEDVYAEFRMRGKTQQGQLMTALRSYTPAQLERGFEQLVRADYEMKSGLIPNELTLSLFLVNSLR